MQNDDSDQKGPRVIYWEGWLLAFIIVPIFANGIIRVLKLAGVLE